MLIVFWLLQGTTDTCTDIHTYTCVCVCIYMHAIICSLMLNQDVLIPQERTLPPDVHTFRDRSLDDGAERGWEECCLAPAFCTAEQQDFSVL